jgi:hypothetical protein
MAISINTNSNVNANSIKYSPEDMEFISDIDNRLTLYGQLPYTIPQKLIVSIIKQSAKWFYVHVSASQKQSYFHISKKDIIADNNLNGFTTCVIMMSPRIRIIKEIYDATETNNVDLSSAMYLSATTGGAQGLYQSNIDNNLYILEGATKMVEARTLKNTFGSHLPFEYVSNSNELILKKIPSNSIVLDCSVDLEIKYLYRYSYFFDYVLSKCRADLKRLLGAHTYNLPGDVVMNAEEICAGFEDWTTIETTLKASNGLGDIIMKR